MNPNTEPILELNCGDVIMTQEVSPILVGALSKRKLKSVSALYGVPDGFKEFIELTLCCKDERTTLFDVYPSSEIAFAEEVVSLSRQIFLSASYSMQWLVKDFDRETGYYSLVAIGQNREARKKDWLGYHELYGEDKVPTLNEYLTVQKVDSQFFEKKAVYRFGEQGMERIK